MHRPSPFPVKGGHSASDGRGRIGNTGHSLLEQRSRKRDSGLLSYLRRPQAVLAPGRASAMAANHGDLSPRAGGRETEGLLDAESGGRPPVTPKLRMARAHSTSPKEVEHT